MTGVERATPVNSRVGPRVSPSMGPGGRPGILLGPPGDRCSSLLAMSDIDLEPDPVTTSDPEATSPAESSAPEATASAESPDPAADSAPDPADDDANPRARFLAEVLAQVGTDFEMGAKAEFDDAKPAAFDASELVEWASHRAGVGIPDGSWIQYQHLHEEGATMSVDEALGTEGALLFWFSRDPIGNPDRPRIAHVAISLGDGRVVEATPGEHDIVRIAEHDERFTHAGEVPGLVGVELTSDQSMDLWRTANRLESDQDQDRLHDATEAETHGTKPGSTDSDNDGVSDLATVQLNYFDDMVDRSDLDADRDGLLDVAEIRLGTDPNSFDTDGDGLDDHLEIMAGLDPTEFNTSMYARSDEGQNLGDHEERAAVFGIATLREHLNYLRLEADPSDPRVPTELRENFERLGREPSADDEAAYDEWHRRLRELQGDGPVEPPADEAAGAERDLAERDPAERDLAEPDPAEPETGVEDPQSAAGDQGPDFQAIDQEIELIESDLLEPFDELSVDPVSELPTIEPIDIDLPVDLDLLGPPVEPTPAPVDPGFDPEIGAGS